MSDDDYQSYLDISNQLAEQFPTLISGYDAQGNAILNLGSNASTAASQLMELYNAQMLSSNVEIGKNLNDTFAGIVTQVKEYQDEINTWENQIEKNNDMINSIDISPSKISDGLIEFDPNAFGNETAKVRNQINDILNKHGITNREDILEDGTIQINTSGINNDIADEIYSVFKQYGEKAIDGLTIENAESERKISANKQFIQDQWDSMADSIGQYIQTSSSFTKLDSALQDAFINNIHSIDASVISDEYDGDVTKFIYSEILNPLSEMKPEAQKDLADLLKLDPGNMNIDEYSNLVSKAMLNAFPDNLDMQNQMKKSFGFDKVIDDAKQQADTLKHTLGDDFSDAIDAMSLDELDKAYDIVINGDEAISTVDELSKKIHETQALAATSVDLNVRTDMDAIEAALESVNAGSDYESAVSYLEKAKELFDDGLIGTDDFKSIAAYLSPTGSDDAVNFAENYSKALRYLTEDGQGVQNFLEDLEKKGLASMETLSDGTQKWKYNIDDLEDAASEMGIGFEFMMDMFGRLEDYGFSNNFIGSVEDGQERLTNLAIELAEEESKLAQLQANGADTTAIEQQQEKVNALKNDINETTDALKQLISKSAADYNEEIDVAKKTISTLSDERKKILNDPKIYGENTDLIAEKLQDEIQSIADEYGLELDADLNIKKPNQNPEIEVDTIVNKDKLDFELSKLSSGESLTFGAEVDGTFASLEALMNQNGTVTFKADIDGVQKQVALVQNEDGVITFTADTSKVDEETDKTDGGTRTTKYKPDDSKLKAVESVIDGGQRAVEYWADTSNLPTSFSTITRTVNYVAQGVSTGIAAAISSAKASGSKATGSMLSPALASGTAYNVLNLIPAHASGNVALQKDEKALVNELDTESIIRDGVWSLLPGGMHIESLKKGDIILNANQTKALMQYGKANGHARAYANGSLLASYAGGSGGGSFFVGGSGSTSNMSGSPSSSNKASNKSSKSTEKAAKSVEDAADKFEESFDEIEILLDRMDRSLNKLTDSIETYSYDLSKQSSISDKAMNQIRSNIKTLQSAYSRYIKEANSVGLSDSWKKKVQNGSINIETITDEDLKTKIDDYQSWYEKALGVQDTIADYQSQLLDLATEKLDNIEQYFDNRTNYNDQFGYLTPITTLQQSVDKLTKELDKQVANGVIKEFSNEWYDAQSKIADKMDQLFEATIKKYQDIIDNLTRISDTLDNSIALKEARDEPILESDYKKQIDLNNESIQEMYNKRQQLVKQQGIYDVGSEKYDDLADQIADIDDEIYGLLSDIEELKDKIWEVRWQPFFDGQEALSDLIDETDSLRELLDSDAFIGENGGLTSEGLANLSLISQAMNAGKQSIRNYQEALKKLDEDLQNGNISTSEYEEQQKDFLEQIRNSVGVVEDYRDSIVDLWSDMITKENDVIQSSIDKHKELLQAKKDNDDYARNVRNQQKDINAIQAQISALSGVQNESAKAELKRLQAQLADAQDELNQTQKDREYDVRQEGYQGLSDDLNDALESTLNEVKYNADKQEQVISEMLDHVVNNYADAYNKINEIISNTGFTPSDDLNNNISNSGSQSGVQDQVNDSNTIAPEYKPDDFVNDTNTDKIQSDKDQNTNDKIESVIEQEPNTTNRPVAQITLKPTSISLEEGKSQTISSSVRPTDAANKKLTWKSSNTKVATVSNGTVKAVKAGSCSITATASDGSGISAKCSVTVKAKPKPQKPSTSNNNGGDGIPKVGDRATLSGSYYYDSWGQRPAGKKYSGVKNGVIIDSYSAKKYGGNGKLTGAYDVHIKSADGKYGDLGWVKLSQLSGYSSGTTSIKNPIEFAKINEFGDELVVKRGGSDYTMLQYGDGVVPADLTKNIFTLAEHSNDILNDAIESRNNNGDVSITNHYDSLLTVNGDVDKNALPKLKQLLEQAYQYTSKKMYRDAGLMGIQRKL